MTEMSDLCHLRKPGVWPMAMKTFSTLCPSNLYPWIWQEMMCACQGTYMSIYSNIPPKQMAKPLNWVSPRELVVKPSPSSVKDLREHRKGDFDICAIWVGGVELRVIPTLHPS